MMEQEIVDRGFVDHVQTIQNIKVAAITELITSRPIQSELLLPISSASVGIFSIIDPRDSKGFRAVGVREGSDFEDWLI